MAVVDNVKQIIDNQQHKGISKYGIGIDKADLSLEQWILHTQEEAADMMIYLEKLKQQAREIPYLITKDIQIDILLDVIVKISGMASQTTGNAYYNSGYVAALYDAVQEVKTILAKLGE
jgi:hypothetical protein